MSRLVQKLTLSEDLARFANHGSSEFYVANEEEADMEHLVIFQSELKKLYKYEDLDSKGLLVKIPFTPGSKLKYVDNGKEYLCTLKGIEFIRGHIVFEIILKKFGFIRFYRQVGLHEVGVSLFALEEEQ